MMYKSFLPCNELKAFIRNYTIINLRFTKDVIPPAKIRSPKAEQKIVFYLKGIPAFTERESGIIKTPSRIAIISHQINQTAINLTSDFFALIIYFQPGALFRLIPLPMIELANNPVDAEDFFGVRVRLVYEQLANTQDATSMITIIEKFLIKECNAGRSSDIIDTIARELLSDPSSFSLDDLSRQAYLSSKQFYRKFTDRIGMTPKLFTRIARFNQAYKSKIIHPSSSWPSIAQEFGYTDYHHMEKEFKDFTGLTPQAWTNIHLSSPEINLKLR